MASAAFDDLSHRPVKRSDARRSRPAQRIRRLLSAVVSLGVLGAMAIALLWPLTPSVDDAQQRIAARLGQFDSRDPRALPMPDPVGQAIIATEDSRFYGHPGVDVLGVIRAVFGFSQGRDDPGGATLDQQLAKVLYTPEDNSLRAKIEQVELAFKFEASYSKTQLLQMYLSCVYFGHGHYGLPAAARGYFGVAPADLTWAQAALLGGLVQAPSAYDPYTHYDLAKRRQRHVLDRLVATGVLTPAQADAAYAAPLGLR